MIVASLLMYLDAEALSGFLVITIRIHVLESVIKVCVNIIKLLELEFLD